MGYYLVGLLLLILPHVYGQTKNDLEVSVTGFQCVSISGKVEGLVKRKVIGSYKEVYSFTNADIEGKTIGRKAAFNFADTVPVTLAEVSYQYLIFDDKGNLLATTVPTDKAWQEDLFPELILPQHADWVTLYKKAWELNWQSMVTSTALPAHFGHNDYPDNNINYVWDACFNSLYQRYGSVSDAHPGMTVLDNFYAQQTDSGFILRHYHWPTYGSGGRSKKETPRMSDVNPALFAWAEWNYYQISADTTRLRKVLPALIKYHEFVESYLRTPSGQYVWNQYASGWDNILTVQPHKYWVELLATQTLAAKYITQIAKVLGQDKVTRQFMLEADLKGKELSNYWNKDKSWYCSIGNDGKFTGKTISGMWPVLTGYIPKENIKLIIERNLFNPQCFFTEMPLPTIAKDEHGYNPKGEYWRGSVWINMSVMTIRGLDEQGFSEEAFELSQRTLNGMAKVYQGWAAEPNSIWECYAPEYPAPASHKDRGTSDLGTVRSEFAGWSCGLINLLIENIMGFHIDAPNNAIHWNIQLNEDFGIKRFAFGKTKTDICIMDSVILVQAEIPYVLLVNYHGKEYRYLVKAGSNKFVLTT